MEVGQKQVVTEQQVEQQAQLELPISKEKAIEIAERQTGGKVIEIELDRDDRRYVYEIEHVAAC
ncbi:PepSY domain-containing protein [Pallidibacillus pasinlerensis]|uniref:PepSY domain-containing protein n=1 Tax=Pallidibacillus pasinlerensis TaxID=2703818 RepID=A0ABX0A6N9_9BACI|nr:PepSY domain-containing protein [Pallidibacillus pasinlerensis]NCU19085.1 hypothetical protein [Pallidibacillus pasinlerensis]